jgi:hypothetical protein
MKTAVEIREFSTEKKYSYPSNMGGLFTIKFVKYYNQIYYFNIINKDFERELTLTQLTIKLVKEI